MFAIRNNEDNLSDHHISDPISVRGTPSRNQLNQGVEPPGAELEPWNVHECAKSVLL